MKQLNNKTLQLLAVSITNKMNLEVSDKDVFVAVYEEYKAVKKVGRGHVTMLLNQRVAEITKSSNVRRAFSRDFKLAFNYVDMMVICKFDNLEYTNIAGLVKLFKYVDKNLSEKSKELRETIMGLYEDNMSPHRYNNVVADKLVQLKEEYKLKEQEDEFVFIDVVNYMKSSITHMSKEQLLEVLSLVEDAVEDAEEVELANQEGVA